MSRENAQAMARYQSARRMVIGAMIALICLLLVFSASAQPELRHEQIEAYGLALMLLGIAGRLWSILYIDGHKSTSVVQTGPYSITRNPLYFFSSLAALGVGAQTGSLLVALACGVICAISFHVVARREERYLTTVLGAPYSDYLTRVPRFFPNPLIYRDQATVTFRPKILNNTLLDGLVFFASIPFFEMIERAQESGFIPVLVHLL
ncbi:isoprenylcysteine carboxylmethyltransferase family protein [Tianweitania sp. BSSL-BM11]|uniref:Isoprenylcysteine carboxylmethyltransferase family protein n=1 Tax=Tianweitania aestuarii TaxID=2814886 RepID=A0ABS5RXD4_9HYPH|nr:isoprenylcysteine carboxylmethyltransferase family protein [Tianweitania aestuarii]MBS9721691.1 isoprenylcysteine carboxylmethyltransferase family protein [Tianweitania aestuarii]